MRNISIPFERTGFIDRRVYAEHMETPGIKTEPAGQIIKVPQVIKLLGMIIAAVTGIAVYTSTGLYGGIPIALGKIMVGVMICCSYLIAFVRGFCSR